jgi:hypothetical protein
MMPTMRAAFIPLAFLWCTAGALAQEISFTASVDRTSIAVGDELRFTLTLVNSQERSTMPDLGGLVIVNGPFDQKSVSINNGSMSSSITRTWILAATAPGTYTIGPAKVRVGGGMIQTSPITVEVVKGTAKPADPNAASGQSRDPNLFATISLSRTKAYVGEQVVASYLLYSRYPNLELSKYELPKMTGFWAEEIDLGDMNWEDRPETVNGIQYRVAVLKRQVLFAQKSGKLRIDPLEMTCVVNRSFFNRGTSLQVRSNAVELTALELPPSPPPGFTGAVGELQMDVRTDRTDVKANEAVQLNVKFSGKGNLKMLEAPELQFPGDFEAYDPKVTDKITVGAGGMSGSREFEYLIIPRREGDFELDPIVFSYFDVKSGAYRTIEADPISIAVAPGDGSVLPSVGTEPQQSEVEMLGDDIRYIRTGDAGLRAKDGLLFGSAPWIAGMGAPALAFVLFLGWRRKHEREQADVAGTRRRLADRVARKHLAEAARLLKQGDRGPFYAALSKALQGYMADKFGLGLAQLNEPLVRDRLGATAEGQALAASYARLITACDMARFAPLEDTSRQQLYDEAASLIGRIEQTVRA